MAKKAVSHDEKENGQILEFLNNDLGFHVKKHKKRKHEGKDKDRHSSGTDGEGKPKNKRHSKDVLHLNSNIEGEFRGDTDTVGHKKRKKHKNKDIALCSVEDMNVADMAKQMTETGKVGKNGSNSDVRAVMTNECELSFDCKQKKMKKKKADLEVNNESGNECVTQKRHKKKKKDKIENSLKQKDSVDVFGGAGIHEVSGEVVEEDFIEYKPKKSKKKKKCKEKIEESDELSDDLQKKCKNKHVCKERIEESSEGLKMNTMAKVEKWKKKKGKHLRDDKCDIQEEHVQNSDDHHKEMNSSFGELTSAKSTKQQFGQWSLAELGTEDRKQKFLRLLGGFKDPSTSQQQTVQMKLVSIAMGSTSQASYMNSLEEQFEKARDISIFKPRGVGLGYEPVPDHGTKLHINCAKSRSIKFDD